MTAPLATFIIVAFKHERFIGEAIQGALAQTYSPLEIIVSDDCSPDGTFEVMQAEAARYTGPHKLIVRRSEQNEGLAQNLNHCFDLASGAVFVVQGGDDISTPTRVAEVMTAFNEPTPVDMVCSRVEVVDEAGQPHARQRTDEPVNTTSLEKAVELGFLGALGCACAYSRRVFDKYGPLDPAVLQEDMILPFRALLEGGVRVLDRPLVKYRIHDANLYVNKAAGIPREKMRRWSASRLAILDDWLRSWRISGRSDPRLEAQLRYHWLRRRFERQAYDLPRAASLVVAAQAALAGIRPRHAAGIVRRHLFRANATTTSW